MASTTVTGAFTVLIEAGKNKLRSANWSSIIGIITAIIGNVLISFALNTQRYAHVRLQKEESEYHTENGSPTPTNGHSRCGSYDSLSAQKKSMNLGHEGIEESTITTKPKPSAIQHYQADADDDYYDHTDTDALLPSSHHDDDNDAASASSANSARRNKSSYLRSPFWWLGIVLMVIGEAGNFLAYGFAPASIVSPLGVVALISNCLIAPIMLHEQFRKRDLLGVLVAVGGAVTVVLSAEGSNPKLGPEEIYKLVKRWEFLTYMGTTAITIVTLMVLSNSIGHKLILIDLGLVGLFGGYTALSTKGVASLLSYKLWRVLTFPVTYVLVLVLVVTAVLQIKYVNRALARFDSTQVIPVQFVMFTISVIVGSAILYRDFEAMTKAKVAQFLCGCGLTFVGVWFLTSGRSDSHNKSAQAGTDEEQGIVLRDDEEQEQGQNQIERAPETPPRPLAAAGGSSGSTTAPALAPAHYRKLQSPRPLRNSSVTNSTPELPTQRTPRWSINSRPDGGQTTTLQTSDRPALTTSESDSHPVLIMPETDGDVAVDGFILSRFGVSRARHSIAAGVSPQPLTTPLSSGLSVVVADNLRKTQSLRGRRRKTSSAKAVETNQANGPQQSIEELGNAVSDGQATVVSRESGIGPSDAAR